jgi:alkylation response protein AidB-like acyl-CoA dehydrogenase
MRTGELPRTPRRDALLRSIRAIAPLLSDDAPESEAGGTLAKTSVDALLRAGLFSIAVPEEIGGAEADPLTQFEVFEEAARADGAAGWCLMIGAIQCGVTGAFLEPEAVRRVLGDGREAVIAGGLVPRGQARRVDGGHRLSGRWNFGSGCRHAAWMILAAVVPGAAEGEDDSANPLIPAGSELRAFLMPVDEVKLHDNWHVAGLRGTASCDYSVEDAFVSEAFSFRYLGTPRRGGALYRLPAQTFVTAGHAGFAIGVGRRALDEITELARGKLRLAASGVLAERSAFQQGLAQAEAKLRAARLLVLDALGDAWQTVCAGDRVRLEQRAAASLAAAHANHTAQEIATFAFRAGGGEALYLDSPIQRCFRDVFAAGQHFAVNDQILERVGQTLLGVAPPGVLL